MPQPMPETPIEKILGFSARDTVMGDYVREVEQTLTLKEVEQVVHERSRFDKGSTRLFVVRGVASDVNDMLTWSHGHLAHWAALGVEHLTDTIISLAEFKTPRPFSGKEAECGYTNLETLREMVEASIAEDEEEVRFDPSYGGSWHDDDKDIVRAWLALTPYALWRLVDKVEEQAHEELREQMFDLARGQEDGKSFARFVDEQFAKVVNDWKNSHEFKVGFEKAAARSAAR